MIKTHFGERITKMEIEKSEINVKTLQDRARRGWSKNKILNTPTRCKVERSNEFHQELAENGLDLNIYLSRLRLGWDEHRAKTTPKRRVR